MSDNYTNISREDLWRKAILPLDTTIREAISNLDLLGIKIVLVINESGVLEGTVSDGDIRRGLLKGLDLNSLITNIIHTNAVVVPSEMGYEMVKQLMVVNKVQQIPVVDDKHQVVGLHLWDEIPTCPIRSNIMVIMAGGMGTRLRPHTENCPKPLLRVAGKPILEHIIERAKAEGFRHFVLAINYLAHMIEEYFGDGDSLGVQIRYLREQFPLGTAGALALLSPHPSSSFIVTNGDIITDIRYGELLDFHIYHKGAATMAVRAYEWKHPFGVVQIEGNEIVGFEEKPVSRSHINAGVYALDSSALNFLNAKTACDMPTLFDYLQSQKKPTLAYPMHEPWLDIGRPDDLNQAILESKKKIDRKLTE